MSDVKRYYVGINTKCLGGIGLVEMTDLYREATGFDGLVMGKDYDAIKAENEALRSDIQSWRLSIEAERNVHKLSLQGIKDELDRLNWSIFTEELAALRKDAERLDWLDGQSRPVVEGQCMSNPEGELTGYDWGIFGQFSTLREAIDYAMTSGDQP